MFQIYQFKLSSLTAHLATTTLYFWLYTNIIANNASSLFIVGLRCETSNPDGYLHDLT